MRWCHDECGRCLFYTDELKDRLWLYRFPDVGVWWYLKIELVANKVAVKRERRGHLIALQAINIAVKAPLFHPQTIWNLFVWRTWTSSAVIILQSITSTDTHMYSHSHSPKKCGTCWNTFSNQFFVFIQFVPSSLLRWPSPEPVNNGE